MTVFRRPISTPISISRQSWVILRSGLSDPAFDDHLKSRFDSVWPSWSSGPSDQVGPARLRVIFTFYEADVTGTDLVIPIHQYTGDVVSDAAGGEYPVVPG